MEEQGVLAAAAPQVEADAVSMSAAAVAHVRSYAKRHGRPAEIRIGVRTSSCSAHAYTFELDGRQDEGDKVFETDGVKVIIDPKSLLFLSGTRIDYRKEGLQEGFAFDNPNVKGTCGCGESFTV